MGRMARSTCTFCVRAPSRRRSHRRLHRGQHQQLEHVIGHHVAQRAGLFVERAAAFDAQRFGRGDLDILDVIAVPYRLEHGVAEAEHHDVLHRLFAEIVIDAVDGFLVENVRDDFVQLLRALQVAAERLLQNDARPAFAVAGQAGLAQPFDDRRRQRRRRRDIKQHVLAGAVLLQLLDLGLQVGIETPRLLASPTR